MSHFHEKAGVYKDTDLDQELLSIIRRVAEAMGHSKDPVETRRALLALGFQSVGTGVGGQATYRAVPDATTWYTLNVTPYGPAILDEMPRFVHLERRRFKMGTLPIMAAASGPEAFVQGLTYSGSYFQSQVSEQARKVKAVRVTIMSSSVSHCFGFCTTPYNNDQYRNGHHSNEDLKESSNHTQKPVESWEPRISPRIKRLVRQCILLHPTTYETSRDSYDQGILVESRIEINHE